MQAFQARMLPNRGYQSGDMMSLWARKAETNGATPCHASCLGAVVPTLAYRLGYSCRNFESMDGGLGPEGQLLFSPAVIHPILYFSARTSESASMITCNATSEVVQRQIM